MKRSRINPVSAKRRKRNEQERQVRLAFLIAHPYCMAKEAGAPGECFASLHVHEPWSRARGGPTDDPRNMTTVCDFHNAQISQDAETMVWAGENNFLVHAWHGEEWLDEQRHQCRNDRCAFAAV